MTPQTKAAGPRTKARKDYEEAWQNGYEAGKTEERERLREQFTLAFHHYRDGKAFVSVETVDAILDAEAAR